MAKSERMWKQDSDILNLKQLLPWANGVIYEETAENGSTVNKQKIIKLVKPVGDKPNRNFLNYLC